jgi:hypothetical protein
MVQDVTFKLPQFNWVLCVVARYEENNCKLNLEKASIKLAFSMTKAQPRLSLLWVKLSNRGGLFVFACDRANFGSL